MHNVLSVCHYFLVTQMADRSQTSTGLSVYMYVYGGLHLKCLHCQQWFCYKKKQFYNVPLM